MLFIIYCLTVCTVVCCFFILHIAPDVVLQKLNVVPDSTSIVMRSHDNKVDFDFDVHPFRWEANSLARSLIPGLKRIDRRVCECVESCWKVKEDEEWWHFTDLAPCCFSVTATWADSVKCVILKPGCLESWRLFWVEKRDTCKIFRKKNIGVVANIWGISVFKMWEYCLVLNCLEPDIKVLFICQRHWGSD